jgi:ABC-type transporter Mla subunit MlaD
MAKSSRVPPAVGALPVVGDLVKQLDVQAQWLQELVEQNARLLGQLPATLKTLNDSLERFNDSVQRLDRMIGRMERTSDRLRDLPALADTLRKEALPALRAATDTQRQVALLQATVERIAAVLGELPGAGLLRRLAGPPQQTRPSRGPDGTDLDNDSE